MKNQRVVIVSKRKYEPEYNDYLQSLIDQNYQLFCVVGIDCQKWEDMIDELAIAYTSPPKYVTTTNHPDETVNDVIEFAKMLTLERETDVDVDVVYI